MTVQEKAGELGIHYTSTEIALILKNLSQTPGSIKALILSAQAGNEDDLEFINQAGKVLWYDATGEGISDVQHKV